MTVEIALVFLIVAVALYLFASERFAPDIAALIILVTVVALPLLFHSEWLMARGVDLQSAFPDVSEGLSGLSNRATVTVLCMFILSAGIERSGLIHVLGLKLFPLMGSSELRQIAIIALLVGPVSGVINNTAAGTIWTFDNARGSFQISRVGSGVAEFKLLNNGDAEFDGNVTANGVVLSSSRTLKTDFGDVDENEILDKVSDLDILQWRYKDEDPSVSHIGPMAEEFQQLFGLGDGRTLNMVDTTGIAFAAIQGLREENRKLRERVAEIDEIRAELRALKAAR